MYDFPISFSPLPIHHIKVPVLVISIWRGPLRSTCLSLSGLSSKTYGDRQISLYPSLFSHVLCIVPIHPISYQHTFVLICLECIKMSGFACQNIIISAVILCLSSFFLLHLFPRDFRCKPIAHSSSFHELPSHSYRQLLFFVWGEMREFFHPLGASDGSQ